MNELGYFSIVYSVTALVRRCIEGLAPHYLREHCCPTAAIKRRISLRSSGQAELLVPRTWNGLPVALRLTPMAHSALFLSGLMTTLFARGLAGSAPEEITLKRRYTKLL